VLQSQMLWVSNPCRAALSVSPYNIGIQII
jgi:hypothetical protein